MKNLIYNTTLKGIKLTAIGLSAIPAMGQNIGNNNVKPNILFIVVDDLKPELGCYGNTMIKTPNIDRLAKMGSVFLNNYCQQAVSGPTRASVLTGKRPDNTGVWDLKTRIRDVNPDVVSLPQYLISQGYNTYGIGKVFDSRTVDKDFDKPSWIEPYLKAENSYYASAYGEPVIGGYQLPQTKMLVEKYKKEAQDKGLKDAEITSYVQSLIRPTSECLDIPDNAYVDGANALKAKDKLIDLIKNNKQFFFAVGFTKPHLPFVAPKKYWDLYNRDQMPLAKFQQHSKNGPEVAYHNSGELRFYSDIPALCEFTDNPRKTGLNKDKQKELIHGYYAATSYTDAQVGILLNTLDSLGVLNNTIIVLWGDHGWHLGDHDLWNKHTNFEQAARSPLIIYAPGYKSAKTKSMSEFIDIFPTICDLAGLNIPEYLDGKSLKPIMNNAKAVIKEFAISQYPRAYIDAKSDTTFERLGYSLGNVMGYSLRTETYRYTLWIKDNYRSYLPFNNNLVIARELYDYKKDPLETVNVVDEKKYSKVTNELNEKLLAFFKSQLKNK